MKRMASKTGAYVGAGIGLALFAFFGLLYGSFIGGVVGLHLTGQLFGSPAEFGILARMLLALGVMSGVLLAAVVCVTGSALIGYLAGCAVDLLHVEIKTGSIIKTQATVK
ncbi:MAG TPA: hypothetical protein DEQ20_02635 [Desulfobulbaceae bacterium]|nr:MAG: hypothetical protein A2520_01510 [Deltaproteobacteria bacterium RIFOXYD12_FULL_53_23]HCC53810.1 hypothetical protein [Desulfobulbaceae bacterium]